MGLRMGRNLAKKPPNSGMYTKDASAKAVDEFKASTPQAILCSRARRKWLRRRRRYLQHCSGEATSAQVYLVPETGIINATDGKLLFELSVATLDMETTRDSIGEKIL
ncbi:hypothetical protein NW754_016744 [Fusarium falciforme]|nr:hypothetical protein NW754_016744 [Fusarium falciforme]